MQIDDLTAQMVLMHETQRRRVYIETYTTIRRAVSKHDYFTINKKHQHAEERAVEALDAFDKTFGREMTALEAINRMRVDVTNADDGRVAAEKPHAQRLLDLATQVDEGSRDD